MEYAFKKKRKLNPREFSFAVFLGVKDGVRTRDLRNHNPAL